MWNRGNKEKLNRVSENISSSVARKRIKGIVSRNNNSM